MIRSYTSPWMPSPWMVGRIGSTGISVYAAYGWSLRTSDGTPDALAVGPTALSDSASAAVSTPTSRQRSLMLESSSRHFASSPKIPS